VKPREHLQHGRSELAAAKGTTTDDEVDRSLDHLTRGVELTVPEHRPIQPQHVNTIKIQIRAVIDESSDPEVMDHLERAKEHYDAVYEAVQTGDTGL